MALLNDGVSLSRKKRGRAGFWSIGKKKYGKPLSRRLRRRREHFRRKSWQKMSIKKEVWDFHLGRFCRRRQSWRWFNLIVGLVRRRMSLELARNHGAALSLSLIDEKPLEKRTKQELPHIPRAPPLHFIASIVANVEWKRNQCFSLASMSFNRLAVRLNVASINRERDGRCRPSKCWARAHTPPASLLYILQVKDVVMTTLTLSLSLNCSQDSVCIGGDKRWWWWWCGGFTISLWRYLRVFVLASWWLETNQTKNPIKQWRQRYTTRLLAGCFQLTGFLCR